MKCRYTNEDFSLFGEAFLIGFCFVMGLLGSATAGGQECFVRTDWLRHLELVGLGPSVFFMPVLVIGDTRHGLGKVFI